MESGNKLTERQRTTDTWLRAAAEFYGMLSMRTFLTLFNRANEPKMLKTELLGYRSILSAQPDANYRFELNYIENKRLSNRQLGILMEYQDGKTPYLPASEELLRYRKPGYYERTPQTKALFSFLCADLHANVISAERLVASLSLAFRESGYTSADVFLLARQAGFEFKDFPQAQKYADLTSQMSNSTRMWDNCGNTPEDLYLAGRRSKK